jgi:thioredoxin reductase (NADPH)
VLTPQEVTQVRVDGPYRIVTLANGSEISCHALLIATGVSYRKLDVPGMERLVGAGVYYGAAMTEAISCQDEHVFVVGGANSAGQAAMYFSKYARAVEILVRADSLAKSMSQYLIDEISATPKIQVRTYTQVVQVRGGNSLEELTLQNDQTGTTEAISAAALFLFIGAQPRTDWLDGLVARDKHGFILSGWDLLREDQCSKRWPLEREPFLLETSVPGIFVAGDVRSGSVKRVASGVGEGSIAIQFVHRYLSTV